MKNINFYQEILDRVNLKDAVSMYHKSGKRGRTSCPFHHGVDNNFCYTDNVYHCWVCERSGNVMTFVMELFSLDADAAVWKINIDFGLNLPLDRKPTLREMRDIKRRQRQRKFEFQRMESKNTMREIQYWSVWDEWIRLDRNKQIYRPVHPGDLWTDEFCEALRGMAYQNYLIDVMD